MPLDEFMFLLTAGTTIIAIGLLAAAAVLTNKYGNNQILKIEKKQKEIVNYLSHYGFTEYNDAD